MRYYLMNGMRILDIVNSADYDERPGELSRLKQLKGMVHLRPVNPDELSPMPAGYSMFNELKKDQLTGRAAPKYTPHYSYGGKRTGLRVCQ